MGVQERKLREKASREQAILAAAKTVFVAKGLVDATIDDIAMEAELGKGTLYRHYHSKEEIMLAICEQAFKELHQRFAAAAAAGCSGLDKMLRTMRAYYEFALDNPAYFEFIAFFESPFTSITPEKLYDISDAILQLMNQLLREGLADGSIRGDLKADLVGNMLLWATSCGIIQFIFNKGSYLFQHQHTDPQELFDTYIAMLDNGLRAVPVA